MLSLLGDWRRTHMSSDLSIKNLNEEVCVMGWVHRRRDHGG